MRRPALILIAAVAATAALAGCGGSSDDGTPAAGASGGSPGGDITVFAAASLTGSFTELGRRFEAAHPGTKVTFSFGLVLVRVTQQVHPDRRDGCRDGHLLLGDQLRERFGL